MWSCIVRARTNTPRRGWHYGSTSAGSPACGRCWGGSMPGRIENFRWTHIPVRRRNKEPAASARSPEVFIMKAIRVHQFGGPEVMKLEELPDPKPGPGQVLLRVKAIGVNPGDTYRRAGNAAVKPTLPYTP